MGGSRGNCKVKQGDESRDDVVATDEDRDRDAREGFGPGDDGGGEEEESGEKRNES